ncbi:MAG: response regulator [Desulfuromonadales bacterium]|nr:response regulator [Desulfuromonadales bacterium]NIS40894.1 response regulator [Desulfuromonadales bacterium]
MARILIVDDEDLVRTTLRQALETADHEVLEAANGKEALEVLENHGLDLVIADIVMPVKEGVETIVELRQRRPDLKIIAISGGGRTGNLDYLELARKFGADKTLSKPFEIDEIRLLVNETLDVAKQV